MVSRKMSAHDLARSVLTSNDVSAKGNITKGNIKYGPRER